MSLTTGPVITSSGRTLNLIRPTGTRPEQRAAQIPPLFARWVPSGPGTGHVVMTPIHPDRIPAGWNSIQVHVPSRPASCEETNCRFYTETGWTEVLTGDGNHVSAGGELTTEQASQQFGVYGPHEVRPTLLFHPPGTKPCPRIHKVPSGIPPLYTINGRPTLWNEFEDAIGNGIIAADRLKAG